MDLPNWLGDWVHALPAIEILLAANREGETTFLLPAGHAPLARLFPAKTLIRPPKAGSGFGRGLGGFDVALTFRHSTRAKLLLAAVPKAEGWASAGRGAGFLGLHTFPVDRARHQRHDFDHALVALGLAPVDGQPARLPFPPVAEKAQRLVVLLPGSLGPQAKRYPPLGYQEVGRQLRAAGFEVLVVVGPSDAPWGIGWPGKPRPGCSLLKRGFGRWRRFWPGPGWSLATIPGLPTWQRRWVAPRLLFLAPPPPPARPHPRGWCCKPLTLPAAAGRGCPRGWYFRLATLCLRGTCRMPVW